MPGRDGTSVYLWKILSVLEEIRDTLKEDKTRTRKPKAVHDPIKLAEILSQVDLTVHRERWEPLGVDIEALWGRFSDRVIGSCNPKKYVDFGRAFHSWCRAEAERIKEESNDGMPWRET